MCIRDSLYRAAVYFSTSLGDDFGARNFLERAVAIAPGHETVSYTHLRAHETVLDLVCRLLLEKKKQPRQKRTAHITTAIYNKTIYTTSK